MTDTTNASASASAPESYPQRLISLDAFRGFTIASMLLVNNPGDWGHIYSQLGHAKWSGWTFTDWVFPFFLFICGVSMTFSLGRRAEAGANRLLLIWQLGKRAAIIFGIGFLLNLIPYFNFETVRIPGVLQRIAICTLLAAPIVVYFSWAQQAIWIVVLLAIYTALMLWLPVPDVAGNIAAGALEPGRDVGAFVDRYVLGGHLWVTSKTWDPEGLLSTIPALCSQLFGVLTGRWLLISLGSMSKQTKTGWMLMAGLVCLIIGSAIDATFMPINKSLWSTSFCIFMTGWALLIFSAFYWLIDANNAVLIRKKATQIFLPFTIYGMNALFIFALSGLIAKLLGFIKVTSLDGTLMPLKAFIYASFKTLPLSLENQSLLFALLFNALMFSVAWWMWKKKWFVKV
jgi:predicted acyltransferase